MKKIYGILACLLLSVFISGCTGKTGILLLQDFWNKEETTDNDSMKFVTGLEIIFPKEWQGNIVTGTDIGSDSNTLSICEKRNAEAGIGGAVFYLSFFEYTEDMYVIMDWDRVLGIYKQDEKEYVLVLVMPGDRQYSEDDEVLINAYMRLSETLDDVIIKTDNMRGFTECGIEDLEWVQYEEEEQDTASAESIEVEAESSEVSKNDGKNVLMAQGDISFGEYEEDSIRLVMTEGQYYTLDETVPGVGTYDENYDGQYVLQLVDKEGGLIETFSLNNDWEYDNINFPGEFELCIGDFNKDNRPDFTIGTAGSASMNLFWIYTIGENGKILRIGEFSDVSKEFSVFPGQEEGSSSFYAVTWNNATGEEERVEYIWNVEEGKYMPFQN